MDNNTENTSNEIKRLNDEIEKLQQEIARLQSIASIVNDPYSNIPANCRNCKQHPSNGGTGICHCILGSQVVY